MNTTTLRTNHGFTLVEILVSISIIGLMSSVVLTSVTSAKTKARDAVIMAEVSQFRTIMEQNYEDFGSYSNLQSKDFFWYRTVADCNNAITFNRFTGPYASKAVELCIKIVTTSQANFAGPASLSIGTHLGFFPPYDTASKFSVMAYLPGKDAYFCMGSGGLSSDTTNSTNYTLWDQPGCFYNP